MPARKILGIALLLLGVAAMVVAWTAIGGPGFAALFGAQQMFALQTQLMIIASTAIIAGVILLNANGSR